MPVLAPSLPRSRRPLREPHLLDQPLHLDARRRVERAGESGPLLPAAGQNGRPFLSAIEQAKRVVIVSRDRVEGTSQASRRPSSPISAVSSIPAQTSSETPQSREIASAIASTVISLT